MGRFIAGRFLQGVFTLLALSAVIFVVSRSAGDPVELLLGVGADVSQEDKDNLRRELGLDKPLINQYGVFLADTITGDFGRSIRTKQPVFDAIKQRMPATLKLASVTLAIAVPLAILLGVLAAVKKDQPIDFLSRLLAVLGQSMPGFWVAIMLILLFSVQWKILPVAGSGSPQHYVLPVATLSLGLMAGLMRLTRSSMLEVLGSDFIIFVRARGSSESTIVLKHALKNAAIPVLTVTAFLLAALVTGSVIVEAIFAWPGMGRLAYDSIVAQDFPIIQATVLLFGAIYIAANLLADILYVLVDPRIRLS